MYDKTQVIINIDGKYYLDSIDTAKAEELYPEQISLQKQFKTLFSPGTSLIAKKIGGLRDLIYYHRLLYYCKAAPEITDREYDKLEKELEFLLEGNPEFEHPLCPTQCVSSDRWEDYPLHYFD